MSWKPKFCIEDLAMIQLAVHLLGFCNLSDCNLNFGDHTLEPFPFSHFHLDSLGWFFYFCAWGSDSRFRHDCNIICNPRRLHFPRFVCSLECPACAISLEFRVMPNEASGVKGFNCILNGSLDFNFNTAAEAAARANAKCKCTRWVFLTTSRVFPRKMYVCVCLCFVYCSFVYLFTWQT